MKNWKRIIAAGLSALTVMGCTIPALAAESVTKKDETLYVVLESDGSVRSQTLSAHLHNESGLSGVEDRTDLTDIENTHDTAAFTQDGDTLRWDTDGTDVYYKGETSRQAPVSASITYELDGEVLPPEELKGRSGHVKVTIKFTNHETGTLEIDGQEYPVCTPFAVMAAAVLGEGWENVTAEHGKVTGTGGTQAAAFACLPGVRECLEEIGSEKLEDLEAYLLDEVSLEGDVTDFTLPDILIACATDTEALKENGFSGLEELDTLDEDMGELREAMDELLDGVDRLDEGAESLESGAAELLAGVNALYDGAQRLMDGTAQLQTGAHQLSSGAAEARDGAGALQSGADSLSAGLSNLQAGAGALSGGFTQLKDGSGNLAAGLNTLDGSSQALLDGLDLLAQGVAQVYAGIGPESDAVAGANAFGGSLSGAAEASANAVGQLPDPSLFADPAHADDPAYQQLLAAYNGAYSAAGTMAGGLGELNTSYGGLLAGIGQISAGVGALQEGVNGAEGLSEGLASYTQGVSSAAAGAAKLDSGISELGNNIPALTGGVDRLAAGSSQISAGAGSLYEGNAALADGAARLAQGADDLASGVTELASGTETLAQGAASLHDGTVELHEGTSSLREGMEQFDQQGISQLTGAIDTEKLPLLREMTSAMRGRLEEYGSFSGAPENAQVTTRFVMKTAGEVEAPAPDEASEETAPEHESLWQRIVGLFKK